MAVDFSGVGSFWINNMRGLQALKNRFEIGINNEGNLALVLPSMEPQKGICFGHVYSHCCVVFAIFKMLVRGHFTVKSLVAVQAAVLLVLVLAVAASE